MTTNQINFTTREEYIAWRAEWRANYAQVSLAIREARNAIKNCQRDGQWAKIYSHYAALRKNTKLAKEMLALREQSKIEAGRQWNERKEASCA